MHRDMSINIKLLIVVLIFNYVRSQDSYIITEEQITAQNITGSELYRETKELQPKSITGFTFSDDFYVKNKNVSFIIFQVHSFMYNVTLSYTNKVEYNSSVNGLNIGLISDFKKSMKFWLMNFNSHNVTTMVSVQGYVDNDPIPGGCNMEFPVPISPFLRLYRNTDVITVQGTPASVKLDDTCTKVNSTNYTYSFYKYNLHERDFSMDTYFDGITKMMSFNSVIENGVYVTEKDESMPLSRWFSIYPGVGSVYVMVVSSSSGRAAYVPIFSYGCDPSVGDKCYLFEDTTSQIACVLMMAAGFFLCYFGHRFFKTEMFLMGFLSGAVLTFIVLSLSSEMHRPALVGASFLSGLCFGSIWLLFWWYYGYPMFSVMLATLNVGFLFASLIYNIAPDIILDIYNLHDVNFWTLFIVIMVAVSLALMGMTYFSNILSCSLLGSYCIVYPIDHYVGSNLKFILVNTIRRAVVPKFGRVNLEPVFQWRDAILLLLWVLLFVTGFLVQYYHNRGKPPFPPPPRCVGPRVPMFDAQSRNYGSLVSPAGLANGSVGSENQPLLA